MLCRAMIIIECPVRLFYRSSPKRHLTTKKTQTDNFFVPWPAIQSFRHKNHTAQWSSSVLIDTTLINASRLPVQTKLIIVVLPSDLTLVTPPLVLSSWYRQVHGPLLVGLFFLTREIPRVLCPTLSSVAALWLFSKLCFIFFFAQFNRDSVQLPREICGLRARNLHHITDSQLLCPIHPIRSRHRSVVHEYSNWSNSADERNSPARILGLLGCLQGFTFFHVAKLSRAEAVNCRRPRRSSRCLVRSPDDLHGEKTQIMTTMVSLRNSGTGAFVAVFSFGSAAPGNWKNVC